MKPLVLLFLFLLPAAALAQDQPVRGEDFVRVPAIGDGLSVSNAFQSNMVIQRDKPITIWGWAAPDEHVKVSFAGQSAETSAAADRSWSVKLEPESAKSTGHELVIQGAKSTLTLENVLVGDVWVLGGQSNMEFDLTKIDNGVLEAISANFPQIRLLTIPRGKGFESVESFERLEEWSDWSKRHFQKGDWEVCSPETVGDFSGIGYVFGRRLHMASGVPIGLIDASVGGTTVETWTPEEVIKEVEGAETKALLANWQTKIDEWDSEADLQKRVEGFERKKANAEKDGKPAPPESERPTDLRPGPIADRNRPGYCYASMIRPLEGLAVKGALFHQGFNNCFNGGDGAKMYYQVFGKMISSWRAAFGDPQLPFCVISLCTAGEPQTQKNFLKPMYDVGPLIREAQHQTYRDLRDAGDEQIGFVSSFDLRISWYHPQIKIPAGERAAKWALATQYELLPSREATDYWLPPSIQEMTIEEGSIKLQMSTDIKTRDDSDGEMLGFAIAGDDRRFHPAKVEFGQDGVDDRNRPRLKKNILVLSSPFVEEPKHYRYAWARNPMANLVNRFRVPLATQRSDEWALEESVPGLTPPEGMDENSIKRWMSNNARKALEQADIERRYLEAQATIKELQPEIDKIQAQAE
ncbi:MAG: sialate O-acetylesterase [Verrucomicrobiota bacterium]